jgi:hypothetical protein
MNGLLAWKTEKIVYSDKDRYIWREQSTLIFENLKPVEKSKNPRTSPKVVKIFKIRRVRLKNQAHHAHR